jgi:hypothetical protein
MVFVTSAAHAHSKMTKQDVNRTVNIMDKFAPLIYIAYIVDFILIITAYYFYFKCNFGAGKISSTGDKILGFLGACCCNLLYVIYHVVVPC